MLGWLNWLNVWLLIPSSQGPEFNFHIGLHIGHTAYLKKEKKQRPFILGRWSADSFSGNGTNPMHFLTSGSPGQRGRGWGWSQLHREVDKHSLTEVCPWARFWFPMPLAPYFFSISHWRKGVGRHLLWDNSGENEGNCAVPKIQVTGWLFLVLSFLIAVWLYYFY